MNNRYLTDPIGHAEAEHRLYDTLEWMESVQPEAAEAALAASAKPGDRFIVKAADRPEYRRVGEYRGLSCGFVVLRWPNGVIQTFRACDVAPVQG